MMWNILNKVGARGTGKPSKTDDGEKSSSEVRIVNNTDKALVFREKVGVANGIPRYSIKAGKDIVIDATPHRTYYRFLVYAVEEVDKELSTLDTGLTIDSDKLSDASLIVFSKDETGKYIIS